MRFTFSFSRLTAFVLLWLVGSATVFAQVTVSGSATNYTTITLAIAAAPANATITVAAGNYVENVLINKSVCLVSSAGRTSTTITGVPGVSGVHYTVDLNGISAATSNVCVKGFTIIGFDNGAAGQENAAVYIQGSHANLQILDNEIQAKGDLGLLSGFNLATLTNPVITGNVFSGKTYTDANYEIVFYAAMPQFGSPACRSRSLILTAATGLRS